MVVVIMVVGLVIDRTSGRSESYGLAMRRVEVSPPPSFHAVDKRSASLRRLLANQALQSSERRPIVVSSVSGSPDVARRISAPRVSAHSTAENIPFRIRALAMPRTSACHGTANTGASGDGSRGSSANSGALKIALPELEVDPVLAARRFRPKFCGEK